LIFNEETIDKFISNSFEIDYINIELTQKTDEDPTIYVGPGTIRQNKKGILELKLYTKIDINKEKRDLYIKHFTPGKIITKDNYFGLKAIDIDGIEWTSDNIKISVYGSATTGNGVVNAQLQEIETIVEESNKADKNYLLAVVPGEFEIPCLGSISSTTSNLKVDLNNRQNRYLIINITSTTELFDVHSSTKIFEAINIAFGKILRPVIIKHTLQKNSILKIKSVPESFLNKELPPPFTLEDIQSFSSFLERYLIAIEKPYSDLYGFWYKINRGWQAGIENVSLPLSVSIEGILNTYFKELGFPDDEIINQAKEAKEKLNKIKLGERIKDRLLSSIHSLLNNPSSKNALFALAKKGIFNKSIVKQWLHLRNKTVHPNNLNMKPHDIQKYIDRNYTCIALFYILLFLIINYEGKYIDYSESGWPEKNFIYKKITNTST